MRSRKLLSTIGAAAALVLTTGFAGAQSPAEFFKSRQIKIVIGHSAGGDYDIGTRLLARYLPKYLPGEPTFIVQNMTGGASVSAANYLYAVAPRDGSVVGSFSRNLPVFRVRGLRNLKADMQAFHWLGATSVPGRACFAAAGAPVQKAQDLFEKELVVAGSGAGSAVSIVPGVASKMLGMKFRIIEGYRGLPDMVLAIQRGEIQGVCMPSDFMLTAHEEKLKQKKIVVLFNGEEKRSDDFPGVPSIYEFAKSEEQKQILRLLLSGSEFGRPYVYPPGVPMPLVEAMRKAIAAAAADPSLKAEADKIKLDMTFQPHDVQEQSLAALAKLPKALLDRAEEINPVTK